MKGQCKPRIPELRTIHGYYLSNHAIHGFTADQEVVCQIKCHLHDDYINECSSGVHKCHAKADCTNTDGSYTYINECSSGVHKCHAKADCTNTDGSYTYSNECSSGAHKCHVKADCTNTDGSYTLEPCENGVAIGMQNKTIPDQYITASSWYSSTQPYKARLGLSGGWSASYQNRKQWLQVNLGKIAKIVRIATQGRQDRYEWVKNYSLSSSVNGSSSKVYDGKRNFSANSDSNTVVAHLLKPAITARYIRVHPITWNNAISMRMELYECKKETCSYALGMQSGVVKDAQLTAKSNTFDYPPSAARLERPDSSAHAWRSKYSGNHREHWLQIEFTKAKQINGVATQGHHYEWVTEYSLQYSNTSDKFAEYTVDGKTKIFVGNVDGRSIVYNVIEPPITAKFIRFLPSQWFSWIALRMELYGCPYMGSGEELSVN
ncbi:hypothetical protein QZH41_003768 [Actinostola sp. cb2023]|nr:hypothetical protein QZH41_003768 [Actinostola sp. cb2023]